MRVGQGREGGPPLRHAITRGRVDVSILPPYLPGWKTTGGLSRGSFAPEQASMSTHHEEITDYSLQHRTNSSILIDTSSDSTNPINGREKKAD